MDGMTEETKVDKPQLMPLQEAAGIIGVHPRTLRRWTTVGEAPEPIKLGQGLYFRRTAFAEWLDSIPGVDHQEKTEVVSA
jgi:predicted site-specific integrase-resolvase